MNKYISSFKKEEVLLGAMLGSLPIAFQLNSLIIAVTTLFFLFKTIKKGNFKTLIIY
jgi:hypothetical protein